MKYIFWVLVSVMLFSCGNEKVVRLPEIDHSEITEITDVSAAYIFYDETKPDSTELNRRNLISTTNWLINVDRRLTLGQVIPHIKFLQDKKANSSHKNESAKNYYTCNDISKKNLGFIEFTNVAYHLESSDTKILESVIPKQPILLLKMKSDETCDISDLYANKIRLLDSYSLSELKSTLISDIIDSLHHGKVITSFNKEVLFQDYIFLKNELSKINRENLSISADEFIY